MNRSLFFIFSFFIIYSNYSQELFFEHFDITDGLPHNTIHCSTQDYLGFMWFGTKSGLTRFDGYDFKLYRNNSLETNLFGSNNIWCIESFKNELWLGTFSGLFRFDIQSEKFNLIEITRDKSITSVVSDEQSIFFVSEGEVFKYNNLTKETHQIFSQTNKTIEHLTITQSKQVWFSSNTNKLFNYTNGIITEYDLNPLLINYKLFDITDIYALDDNSLIIGTTNNGIYIYDIENHSIKKIQITENELYVRDILVINDDIWLATESGIYIYNLKTKKSLNYKKDHTNPYAISDNAIYSLSTDNLGGIWISSYFAGLNYIPKTITPFNKYYYISHKNSISGNSVREITSDESGLLWIGTEDSGLNTFNTKSKKFKKIVLKRNSNNFQHDNIHGILVIKDRVWVGTFENGLYVVNRKSGKVLKHYEIGKKSGLKSNFIHGVYKISNGSLFITTSKGLYQYNKDKDKFYIVKAFHSNIGYTCFMEDSEGRIWAGTYNEGLYRYDPMTNILTTYKQNSLNNISCNAINNIFQDSENNIWVTTEYGLNLLKSDSNAFEIFSIKDGYPSNIFYSVVEDKNNSLWISTANGLVHYDTKTKNIRTHLKENGILSNQFNYKSGYLDSNGILYFGSNKGMISFNPNNFLKKSRADEIVLTELLINNKKISIADEDSPLKKSITLTNTINLNHKQSTIKINFSSLDFHNNGLYKYAYKLKGIDDEWTELGHDNSVSLAKINPGNYEFLIKSSKEDNIWSEEKVLLKINIKPIFWASNLAYFLYFIILCIIFYYILRYHYLQLKSKNSQKLNELNNRKEKEIYEAKIDFFTNISHEIRTPLTLIKSPLDKLLKINYDDSKLKENLSIMSKNTNRLLDLTKQLLDFRKTEMEKISLIFIETNISELIRSIHLRFKPALEDQNIDFTLNIPVADIIAYVDAEALKKIFSNLFSNALKYSDKKIELFLKEEDLFFKFQLKNDGPLIPSHLREKIFEPFYRISANRATPGSGIGLSLALSLTKLHQGTLKLDASNSLMNCFILKLPLHQEREFNSLSSPKKYLEDYYVDTENRETSKQNGHRSAILLVEDNEDLLDFVAKDLTENYLVIKATNAEDALKIIQTETIQLIISDVMMPGMNGFELCTKVKTDVESSHIPIILLTSKSAIEAKIEGLESGADAYIEKPFSIDYLKHQIENLVKNRKHIINHFSTSPLAHIRSIAHTEIDEKFIKKLDEIIINNISNANLNVDTLAEIMNMSRSSLYRKIKDISNLSPNELINISRLKKAANLLKTNDYRIYEVAEMVGFNSATSFGRSFQKQFNMTPTEYVKFEER